MNIAEIRKKIEGIRPWSEEPELCDVISILCEEINDLRHRIAALEK